MVLSIVLRKVADLESLFQKMREAVTMREHKTTEIKRMAGDGNH